MDVSDSDAGVPPAPIAERAGHPANGLVLSPAISGSPAYRNRLAVVVSRCDRRLFHYADRLQINFGTQAGLVAKDGGDGDDASTVSILHKTIVGTNIADDL